jgi:hypothetical protein
VYYLCLTGDFNSHCGELSEILVHHVASENNENDYGDMDAVDGEVVNCKCASCETVPVNMVEDIKCVEI